MAKSSRAGFDSDINLVIFVSLVLTAIGVGWLALNEIISGQQFTTIFLVSIALFVLSLFFVKEKQRDFIVKGIKTPFTTDNDVAVGLYLTGILGAVLIQGVFGAIGSSFSISDIMIPLSASDVNQGIAQSFSVAQTQLDPFWQLFMTVFVAGTIEEFVFGFVLMFVGVIIGAFVWRMLIGTDERSDTAQLFFLAFGLIFTALLFGGAHALNGSYVTTQMFIVAMVFRLAMNISLYRVGLFLSLTMGYHQANNFLWYYTTFGATPVLQALGSTGGLLILALFGLILFYAIRRASIIIDKTQKVFLGG